MNIESAAKEIATDYHITESEIAAILRKYEMEEVMERERLACISPNGPARLPSGELRFEDDEPAAPQGGGVDYSHLDRQIFDAGFQACRRFGDNWHHYDGEQGDRVFAAAMERIAPQSPASPPPAAEPRKGDLAALERIRQATGGVFERDEPAAATDGEERPTEPGVWFNQDGNRWAFVAFRSWPSADWSYSRKLIIWVFTDDSCGDGQIVAEISPGRWHRASSSPEVERLKERERFLYDENQKVRKLYHCPKCKNIMQGPMNLRRTGSEEWYVAWLCCGVGCGYQLALATPEELVKLCAAEARAAELDGLLRKCHYELQQHGMDYHYVTSAPVWKELELPKGGDREG